YTVRLLEHVGPDEWFRLPPGAVSTIGWQAGHLAVAQYRLALERIRGRRPGDEALIADSFRQRYGYGSVPDPDPARNSSPEELRAVLDRVHRQVLQELASLPEEELAQPTGRPHPQFDTKQGALFWCARHEMLHAGQIGLLRRLLGHAPLS